MRPNTCLSEPYLAEPAADFRAIFMRNATSATLERYLWCHHKRPNCSPPLLFCSKANSKLSRPRMYSHLIFLNSRKFDLIFFRLLTFIHWKWIQPNLNFLGKAWFLWITSQSVVFGFSRFSYQHVIYWHVLLESINYGGTTSIYHQSCSCVRCLYYSLKTEISHQLD